MSKGRKVFGVVPPTGKFIREDRCQTPIKHLKTVALRPPIDLMYAIGSFEEAGCESRIRDYPGEDLAWADLERDLREFAPDMLVMSITTPSLDLDMEAATLAKRVNPAIVTIAKGAHFNTLDLKTLERFPDLDVVLRGEYEETCRELGEGKPLDQITGLSYRTPTGELRRNADRPLPGDLDTIAFPARHLTKNALYLRPDTGEMQTTILTNRGCPFHCIYCLANQVSGTKNRYRSVENVMAEIKQCVEVHGIRNFLFRSDLFTQNKKWVIRLCEAIIESKLNISWASNSRVDTINPEVLGWMKKAGCWIIAFGVESGNQETLDKLDKGAKVEDAFRAIKWVREAGLRSSVYLLMGLPWDTHETIREQSEFARKLDPDILEIFYAYPFPGTPFYDLAVREGLLEAGSVPLEAYDAPAIAGHHLTVEEFQKLRRKAMRDFYLRPEKIFRTLRAAGNPRELFNYVRLGMVQLKDLVANG